MVDGINDREFDRLLRNPRFSRFWEAIMISGGGNDLIDAAQHRATNHDGSVAALDERVLLTPAEAALVNPHISGPERYVSSAGWARLAGYLVGGFTELARRRDQGPSAGRPILLHTYHEPVVRPVGTVGSPRGWLFAAMVDYGIPVPDRQGVTRVLFEKLRLLLLGLGADSGSAQALPHVHVFDSAALAHLTPPDPASLGPAADWVNEIHPSKAGYAKIGRLFGPWVDQVLATYP